MIKYVDFDGVLAKFDVWHGPEHLGEPIPEMIKKVKRWIFDGDQIIIYTARMTPGSFYGQTADVEKTRKSIEDWCRKYLGLVLPVTNIKSYADVYYDDKCSRIIPNTGLTLEESVAKIASEGLEQGPCADSLQKALFDIMKLLRVEPYKEVDHDI